MNLAGAGRLQACLHMTARFGADDAALLECVPQPLRADHFQIQWTGVAVIMQHTDITDQVDIAAAVGLIFRRARSLLPSFAIADVYVFDARDDGFYRFDRIFAGAVDMRGIHVQAEPGRSDIVQNLEARWRVVDVLTDMRFGT